MCLCLCVYREWRDNIVEGLGHLKRSSGVVYDGEYHGNVRSGFGKLQMLDNGGVYEGMWHNDRRHGRGRIEFGDGSRIEGMWKDGVLVGLVEYGFAENSSWLEPHL